MLQLVLALMVVVTRRRVRQSLGDGNDEALLRAVRRHGNFAENAAIFLVALALVELLGAPRLFVASAAALFLAGRLAHAYGLSQKQTVNPWRVGGVVATVAAGFAVGVRLVGLGLDRLTG